MIRPTFRFAAALGAWLVLSFASNARAQQQLITPSFRGEDLENVIQMVQEVTGKSFVIDPRIPNLGRGVVHVYGSEPLTVDEFYGLFLAILSVNDLAAVDDPLSGSVKILQASLARVEEGDSWVTRGLQLRNTDAAQLAGILRPMVHQQALLMIHPASNMLLVSDAPDRVERVFDFARQMDEGGQNEFDVVPLRYAAVADVVPVMTQLSQAGQARQGMPPVTFVADERSNSIVMTGLPGSLAQIRRTIEELDTPTAQGGSLRDVVYLNYATASELAEILEQLFGAESPTAPVGRVGGPGPAGAPGGPEGGLLADTGPVTILADDSNNALIINAPERVRQEIAAVIASLDIPRLQVQVEVLIVEISQQKAAELGVSWASDGANDNELIGLTNFSIGTGIIPLAAASAGDTPDPSAIGGGLTAAVGRIRDSGTSWAAIVSALRGDADANIVATTTIVTLDNEVAEISVGQNVPLLGGRSIQTGSGSQTPGGQINPFVQNQQIDRQDVGNKLSITPQINAGDGIKLTIAQEQSSVAPSVEGAADIILNTRTIDNVVFVRDGDLLVLGGLIDDQLRLTEERVPGLGRIPGLRWLFKANRTQRQRTNLMVFIRPTILHDQAEAGVYTSGKYEDLRAIQQELAEKPVPLMRDEEQPVLPPFPAPNPTPAPDTGVPAETAQGAGAGAARGAN